jgi:hypothetical protein
MHWYTGVEVNVYIWFMSTVVDKHVYSAYMSFEVRRNVLGVYGHARILICIGRIWA